MRNEKPRTVVFDEDSRKEFVTGFRKRKLAKKKKIAEEFERKLKEAKKEIRKKVRETYKQIVQPNMITYESMSTQETSYELPEHTVQIRELIPNLMSDREDHDGNKLKSTNEETVSGWTNDDEVVPGMSVTSLKEAKKTANNLASALMRENLIFKKKNRMEKIKNRKQALRKKKMLKKELKKIKGRKRK